MAAVFAGEDLQDGARAAEAALGGLVRVRGGPYGDAVLQRNPGQFAAQDARCGGFGVDLIFEFGGVLHSHEFVGIAGVAVAAAELAAPVGVNGPAEGHIGLGAIEDGAGGNLEIADLRLRLQQIALGGQACNAGQHAFIFAVYSL